MTAPSSRVAVVGAGTSALVAALLGSGFEVVANDISPDAVHQLCDTVTPVDRDRLSVEIGDVCDLHLSAPVATWHDRAVFHFLTDPADQRAYVDAVRRNLSAGGHVVIATFAPTGPESCSGLPVARHDAASLAAVFGADFELIESSEADHHTPWGTVQRFTHAILRRVDPHTAD